MKPFSSKKDLKSEYDYLIQKIKQKDSFIIIDSGKTDFLINEAYFIHSKSNSGNYGELEMITIIIKSSSDNNYFYSNAGASRTRELNKSMSIMLTCLKTCKQKN